MNLHFSDLLPEDFSSSSRVWIYQSSRLFTISETLEIEEMLHEFVSQWNSHGTPVKGFGTLFFGQFIILMADESATGVSGCSTDSSVRVVKSIESKYGVKLFDRQLLAFVVNDKLQLVPMSQLRYAIENLFITGDSLYFNNTVQTKEELQNNWIIPVKESWLASRLNFQSGIIAKDA